MPVIFGAPNLLKNFKDIGLYTWNDYFGFEGDELYEFDKVKSFKKNENSVKVFFSGLIFGSIPSVWLHLN